MPQQGFGSMIIYVRLFFVISCIFNKHFILFYIYFYVNEFTFTTLWDCDICFAYGTFAIT